MAQTTDSEKFHVTNKAVLAKKISYVILLVALFTGLCLHYFILPKNLIGTLLFYGGFSGLIGLGTNTIAIKMILDYVYVPFTKIKVPMSGLLPDNFSSISESIGKQVAHNILNPETLKQEIRHQAFFEKLIKGVKENDIPEPTLQKFRSALCQIVRSKIETDDFYFEIKNSLVKKFAGKKMILRLANATGLIDYDDTTYQIIDMMHEKIQELETNPKTSLFLRHQLHGLITEVESNQAAVEEVLLDFLSVYVLHHFDIASAIKNKLATFSAHEVKAMVLEVASEYLGWIEVLGGILGAIVGLVVGNFT